MGQILRGCTTTTEAVRRAIQHSQASLREFARRYGVNPKTIAKWRKRTSVADLPTGPREAHSSTLSPEQEALIAAVPYRIHTLLTDNGIQFRFAPRYAGGPKARYMTHMFAMRCQENGIEHCFTKINHS